MKTIAALLFLFFLAPTPIDPTFQRDPKGWMPICPAGYDVVRHDPPPDCFWGKKPIPQKPTEGDFECVPLARIPTDIPACPVE